MCCAVSGGGQQTATRTCNPARDGRTRVHMLDASPSCRGVRFSEHVRIVSAFRHVRRAEAPQPSAAAGLAGWSALVMLLRMLRIFVCVCVCGCVCVRALCVGCFHVGTAKMLRYGHACVCMGRAGTIAVCKCF